MVEGKITRMEKLSLKDAYEFQNWGQYENPLLRDYNFIEDKNFLIKNWYQEKTKNRYNEYWTIFANQKPVGFISFKKINKIFSSAVLGLAIGAKYNNLGYGQDALKTMADYYFKERGLKKITLKVAAYNKKAIHIYEKIGFKKVSKGLMFLEKDLYQYGQGQGFVKILGKKLMLYIVMKLEG